MRVPQGLTPEMRLQIMAPGQVESFTGKARATCTAKLAKVEADHLILAQPLAFPVPAKTRIVSAGAPNAFDLRGACEHIVIEGLTIDGGRTADDPASSGHTTRCGILAHGDYNYTDGRTGKPIQRLVIRECTIRNCFGRGIALYAVTDALIAHCAIGGTTSG